MALDPCRALREHADALRGATVIADGPSASFLASAAALQTLCEEFGVLALRRLSDAAEPLPPLLVPGGSVAEAKLCFLISGYLADAEAALERAAAAHRGRCLEASVLCELSDEAQANHPTLRRGYDWLTRELRGWLSVDQTGPEPRVSVAHAPAQFVPVLPGLFFLPGHERVSPLLAGTLREYARATAALGIDAALQDAYEASAAVPLNEITADHLPPRIRAPLAALAHALGDLFAHLRSRMEVWAVGPTARLVARELLVVPKPAAAPTATASLVLVDRALDLVAPLQRGENLLDRALECLPRNGDEGGYDEGAVWSDPATLAGGAPPLPEPLSLGGVLGRPGEVATGPLLQSLASRPPKEVLAALQKRLVEALVREGLPLPPTTAGAAGAPQLRPLLDAFLNPPKGSEAKAAAAAARQRPLLSFAAAVSAALEYPGWDDALASEKALYSTIAEGAAGEEGYEERAARGAAVSRLLADLLTGPSKRPPGDVLRLAAYASSLGGPSALDWGRAAGAAGRAGRRRRPDAAWLEARSAAAVARLADAARARDGLSAFKTLLREPAGGAGAPAYVPLAAQLARHLADERATETPDLEHVSVSLGGFLKSGLGRFGLLGQGKPRPGSNPLLVVFFVGGVTAQEAKEVAAAFAGHKCQVLVGGTALSTPRGALGRLLASPEDALRAELGL
eukprot:tig00000219_g19485.t1